MITLIHLGLSTSLGTSTVSMPHSSTGSRSHSSLGLDTNTLRVSSWQTWKWKFIINTSGATLLILVTTPEMYICYWQNYNRKDLQERSTDTLNPSNFSETDDKISLACVGAGEN